MTTEETIRTAIEYEIKVRDMYFDACESVSNSKAKSILRVLAQENRDLRMSMAEKKAAGLPPKLTVPMILFFNLAQVTTVAALVVLLIQGLTHLGHLRRIKETGANVWLVSAAIAAMFGIAGLTVYYTYMHMPTIGAFVLAAFALAIGVELLMRLFSSRVVKAMTEELVDIEHEVEDVIKKL